MEPRLATFAQVLVDDLFFATRIREVARSLSVPVEVHRDPATFAARVAETAPPLVIVDLNLRGGDALAAVRALRAAFPTLPIVAYAFDQHHELWAAAEAAGCARVLSRGQLTKQLPRLLGGTIAVAAPRD